MALQKVKQAGGSSSWPYHIAGSPVYPVQPPEELHIYYLQGRITATDLLHNNTIYLGTWVEEDLNFIFFSSSAPELIRALLESQPWLSYKDHFQMSYAQWLGHELQTFQAGRWRIIPVWDPASVVDPTRDILLDPGLVFGSGQHPSTRSCLQALDWLFQKQTINSVLDLGSGSGILALAAALSGAEQVLALDLNPLASSTTLRNVCLNNMQTRILTLQARAQALAWQQADVMLANIHLQVLLQLVQNKILQNKKWFIVSGLLNSQSPQIMHVLRKNHNLQELHIWDTSQDWVTLMGKIHNEA